MKKNSRLLRQGAKLPHAMLRAHLVAVLVGATAWASGCAAGPAGTALTHVKAPQAAVARKTVQVRAQVYGEGTDVLVTGTVRGIGSSGNGGHADIAVYAADGRLILSASAPYVTADTDEASFEKRLPGLRSRKIRLRLVHHGVEIPAGSGSCPNNAALQEGSGGNPAGKHLEERPSREHPLIEV